MVDHAQMVSVTTSNLGPSGLQAPLPRVRQTYNWDCGLACIASLLGGADLRDLHERAVTRSIWSVDLALLLRGAGVPVIFYTIAPDEVPSAHAALTFYAGPTFATEAARVRQAFADARALGVAVRATSLPLEYIVSRLRARTHVFIALLDLRWVRCTRCHRPTERRRTSARDAGSPLSQLGVRTITQTEFAGHYVLLTGYDEANGLVEAMDPAGSSCERCWLPVDALERGRRAQGTDEDLLEVAVDDLVVWHNSCPTKKSGASGSGGSDPEFVGLSAVNR
jgi:hypothetical protein